MLRLWFLALVASGLLAMGANAQPQQARVAATFPGSHELPPWLVPDIAGLPDDENGKLVRDGKDLIDHTWALIGPQAPNAAQRFSGNGLECTNCHIDSGTARYALPLVGIAGLYPRFSARVDAQQDLADRVNDCMERSMNGRALPRDSHEMKALLAYLTFLGSQQPAGEAPVGRGAPALPLPTRAASPQRGAAVFQNNCAACHQSNGLGLILQSGDQQFEKRRYVYPPLWGPESYNDAAGMARVITGAWFVHANMPKGITFEYPLLSADDAYDVMAFVDTQPRPHKADLSKDYPDLWLKPIGTPYPPWVGHFSAAQNRYGPWQPILDWRRKNLPPPEAKSVPAANDLEQSVYAAGNR
jgi:thiosulfate dehydrogenase